MHKYREIKTDPRQLLPPSGAGGGSSLQESRESTPGQVYKPPRTCQKVTRLSDRPQPSGRRTAKLPLVQRSAAALRLAGQLLPSNWGGGIRVRAGLG